eukprot:373904-Amphidinium_carterae.1
MTFVHNRHVQASLDAAEHRIVQLEGELSICRCIVLLKSQFVSWQVAWKVCVCVRSLHASGGTAPIPAFEQECWLCSAKRATREVVSLLQEARAEVIELQTRLEVDSSAGIRYQFWRASCDVLRQRRLRVTLSRRRRPRPQQHAACRGPYPAVH